MSSPDASNVAVGDETHASDSPAMPDMSSGSTPLRTTDRNRKLRRQYQQPSPGLRRLDFGPFPSPLNTSVESACSSRGSMHSFWDAVAALPLRSPSFSSPSRNLGTASGLQKTPTSLSRRSWNPMAETLLRMPSQDETSETNPASITSSPSTAARDTSIATLTPIKMVTSNLRDLIPSRGEVTADTTLEDSSPTSQPLVRPIPQRLAIPPLRKKIT